MAAEMETCRAQLSSVLYTEASNMTLDTLSPRLGCEGGTGLEGRNGCLPLFPDNFRLDQKPRPTLVCPSDFVVDGQP